MPDMATTFHTMLYIEIFFVMMNLYSNITKPPVALVSQFCNVPYFGPKVNIKGLLVYIENILPQSFTFNKPNYQVK